MEDRYDTKNTVIYWKLSDIRDWCQLKENIPMINGGLYFGDRRIKCLQALVWCGTDFTLWFKPIEVNNFIVILCLMILRSPRLTMRIPDIVKEICTKTKSFFMINGLSGNK